MKHTSKENTMNTQPNMTEQELLNDLLNQGKAAYVIVCDVYPEEASCENLRKVLTNQFNQTSQDQYQVFGQMRQKGYYQPKDASAQEVQQTKDNFRNIQGTAFLAQGKRISGRRIGVLPEIFSF